MTAVMHTRTSIALLVIACCAAPALAQPAPGEPPEAAQDASRTGPKQPPHVLVRKANELLREGEAQEALPLYDEAAELAPEAREISFSEGLAHYELGEFDEARAAFLQAMRGDADRTAIDAEYSLATVDHAEALAQSDDPQAAIESLESAMRGYQSVLEKDPNFAAAQRSNRKAAAMRRKLKQIQQQQQEQQQQNEDSDEKNDEQKEDEQDSQQQSNENDESQQNEQDQQQPSEDQQQSESSDQQNSQQQNQQDQNQQDQNLENAEPSDKNQEQNPQDQKSEENQDEQQSEQEKDGANEQQTQQQQAAAEQDHSREQSERRLREMMEAIRDRKKKRKPIVVPVPVRPADKDW